MMKAIVLTAVLTAGPVVAESTFEDQVLQAILDNPEVVLLAIQKLEEERTEAEALVEGQKVQALSESLFGTDENIQLVEFFDYRCGYCAQSANTMLALPHQMTTRVRLIEFPILGEASTQIAKVSLAVRNIEGEEAYKAFHFAVFEAAGRVGDTNSAVQLAGTMGLDMEAIQVEAESNDVAAELLRNQRLARELGIRGTPTFVGRDKIYDGLLNPDELVEILGEQEEKL
jgi:protein-disulfide isomerase